MVVVNNEIDVTKNAGKLSKISMTMRMRRCYAGHIARRSTSRASLKATGCRHRVMVDDFGQKKKKLFLAS